MLAQVPPMLHRWNAFETVYNRACLQGIAKIDAKTFAYYVDNLKAACTGRMTRANSLFMLDDINDMDALKVPEIAWRDFYTELARVLCQDYEVLLKREGLTDDFFFEGI